MLETTILALEVLVLVLVAYVGARSFTLARRESSQLASANSAISPLDNEIITVEGSDSDNYNTRIETLKEAQIFAGIQMIPVKREFTDLLDPQLMWLREAIAYYLIGASDFIAKQSGCDLKTRTKYNDLVLTTNLKLDQDGIRKLTELAAQRTKGSDEDMMVIAGAKAAKQWIETKSVNDSLKLRTRLNDWGVFA